MTALHFSPEPRPFRSGICDCMGRGYFMLGGKSVPCLRCKQEAVSNAHSGRRHATVKRLIPDQDSIQVRSLKAKLRQSESENRRLRRDKDAMLEQGEKHGINLQPAPRLGRPPSKAHTA